MALDIEGLLAGTTRRLGQSDARKRELARRRGLAMSYAKTALLRLHRSDYDELYQQALSKVDAARGPLPE